MPFIENICNRDQIKRIIPQFSTVVVIISGWKFVMGISSHIALIL